MIDYYKLRFQIEFNFRDAKQHWGLEDFMNTKEIAVANAASLSLVHGQCRPSAAIFAKRTQLLTR